ncbi:uncharacterized protein PAC_07302 [Phialocephala subalpina]|uniref:Uncharacterized protein n=1 Tax=Phialocephala subalpina TaxID=576137 RepID=A0A1L7WXB3_9HELO|nr:uncharacterized protein PAC_07302 [Phialocephala subalpina]
MCQAIPFTLPCCRRVYVSISRLPSCPASWPKSKCPPELCIQVRGTEPEERPTGVCWRCKAQAAGKTGFEKDMLRPGIDKAYIVLGLEELGITGRRRQVEEDGHCWFCNARGGCKECGAHEIKPEDQQSRGMREETPIGKKRHREPRPERERTHNKRVKVEKSEAGPSTPRSMFSTPRAPTSNLAYSPPINAGSYPDPNVSMMWQPQMHPGQYGPGYNHDASSPYQGMTPQQQTPPNQRAMFNQPGSGSWNPNSVNQNWQGMPFLTGTGFAGESSSSNMQYNASAGFVDEHSGGNYQYNAAFVGLVGEESSGSMQNIDPTLLQPDVKLRPEPKSEPSPPTQAPWNDDSLLGQGDLGDFDEDEMTRIFDNFNKEQAEKEQEFDQEGAQQSTYIDPKLLFSS